MAQTGEVPVHRTPLTEQVYLELKRQILTGAIPAGTRLTANDCAVEFGTSPTPVREAFNKLRVDGLLRYSPWQETVVTMLTARDMRHLFSVREALECLAVRDAGPLLKASDLAWLTANLAQFQTGVSETPTNHEALHQSNKAFHELFWAKCGNPWLASALDTLQDLLVLARVSPTTQSDGRSSLAEHQRIVAHLLNRDWDMAAEAMGHHIRRVKQAALETALDDVERRKP